MNNGGIILWRRRKSKKKEDVSEVLNYLSDLTSSWYSWLVIILLFKKKGTAHINDVREVMMKEGFAPTVLNSIIQDNIIRLRGVVSFDGTTLKLTKDTRVIRWLRKQLPNVSRRLSYP